VSSARLGGTLPLKREERSYKVKQKRGNRDIDLSTKRGKKRGLAAESLILKI